MLLRYLTQTSALPEHLVILSVLTSDVPEVDEDRRVEIHVLGHGVYRVTAGILKPNSKAFLAHGPTGPVLQPQVFSEQAGNAAGF